MIHSFLVTMHDLRRIILLQNELSNEQSHQFIIQDLGKQTVRLHELSLIWTIISGRIIRPKSVFKHAERISVAARSPPTLDTRGLFSRAADGNTSLGFGGRRRPTRAAKQVIIQTWPTPETAKEKPLVPRVVVATSFSSKYTKQVYSSSLAMHLAIACLPQKIKSKPQLPDVLKKRSLMKFLSE